MQINACIQYILLELGLLGLELLDLNGDSHVTWREDIRTYHILVHVLFIYSAKSTT